MTHMWFDLSPKGPPPVAPPEPKKPKRAKVKSPSQYGPRTAEITEKVCSTCKETKPVEAFRQYSATTALGFRKYSAKCKACDNAAREVWRRSKGIKPRVKNAHVTEKTCNTCHETKPVSEFYPISKTRKKPNAYRSPCKICFRAAFRKRWKEKKNGQMG